ncbi:hypothetical protein AQUSIP_01310 [Aquicella siphonis]|uniref:Lysosomal dipeptide transporter MFSD1 n=2 Tax=Aquicella siphonis TaxID=254247 RepID=A0A5E4PEK9_9COXI|nr:hypothetical protein AQUSIP_01310 [Aquicella siphonis]
MIFICQLLLGIFCYVFANSTHLWMAVISRVLMGIVCAPTFIAAFYLIAHTLPEKYFAVVAGFTEMLAMLGGVAGEALLARSVVLYGWQHTVMILAGVALTMSFLGWVLIRDESKNMAPPADDAASRRHVLRDLTAMLMLPQAWVNGLFCGLLFGVIAAFGAFWCIPFLMQKYGVPLGHAADASSMIFIGAAVGTPLTGWLADRLDARKVLMHVCSGLACLVFLAILYLPLSSFAWIFPLIFMLGFFSAVYVIPFAVIRDITPHHMRGTAMGYINMMCILIGSPLLQPLMGYILHRHDPLTIYAYQHAFLVIPVCLLTAFMLAFYVQEK